MSRADGAFALVKFCVPAIIPEPLPSFHWRIQPKCFTCLRQYLFVYIRLQELCMAGIDQLKHIVVLMMENRSFDHMLGGLMKKYPKINGLTGNESNPDTNGALVMVQPNAQFQSQLDPDPDHHFPGVDLQVFGGAPPGPGRVANMQGFVKDYFSQTKDVNRSHNIMSYFTPDKLPVLTNLATEFALFNGWFSSIPGPTICNRAFAHYG